MAQRAYDLLTLPYGLNETPAILQVAHIYLLYLKQFQECPVPSTEEKEETFTELLRKMILERSKIPNAIARGIDTWRIQTLSSKNDDDDDEDALQLQKQDKMVEMEDALYRFFTARVGVRFLTQHHIMSSPKRLLEQHKNDDDDDSEDEDFFLGCIQTNCSPYKEVTKVVNYVEKQTKDYYGICPEIQIIDAQRPLDEEDGEKTKSNNNKRSAPNDNFTYVPHHLRYMVGELLKNSCRATVKRYACNENR
jgi:pyruvate dehydrogenase kinase 2/3/4